MAPMTDWTDLHCRYFLRLFSPYVLLYTEMIVANAVFQGDRDRLLAWDLAEHPVALQLGGRDPATLALAVAIGVSFGYDEINLNIGCSSDRVQSATSSACLMAEPRQIGVDYVQGFLCGRPAPISGFPYRKKTSSAQAEKSPMGRASGRRVNPRPVRRNLCQPRSAGRCARPQ